MTTDTCGLPVTIVSTDRALLCELSWTLSLFGYCPATTSDYSEASMWRYAAKPSLLLVDARDADEADRFSTSAAGASNYLVAIGPMDVECCADRLLSNGADDVIGYPINTGELLARLRTGVRRLEFERRLASRQQRDAVTGASTQRSLVDLLERRRDWGAPLPGTLVACGIDALPLIRQQHGDRAAQQLTATLGCWLTQAAGEEEPCARLGEDGFAVALDRPLQTALEFAWSLVNEFAGCGTLAREHLAAPTISAVVAVWRDDASPGQQLEELESTFEQAGNFGGNCAMPADEVTAAIANWRAEIDAGVPFENVVAQDIMDVFPLVWTRRQLEAGSVATVALPQHAAVACVPVIDDETGVLCSAAFLKHSGEQRDESPVDAPTTVRHDESLSELSGLFATAMHGILVVVEDTNRPVGYITCESFASLVLDRIDAANYRPVAAETTGLKGLVVPVEPVASQANCFGSTPRETTV